MLIEGPSRGDEGRYRGRTERNEIVHVLGPEGVDLTGRMVGATITEANKHSLMGEARDVGEAPTRRSLPVVA